MKALNHLIFQVSRPFIPSSYSSQTADNTDTSSLAPPQSPAKTFPTWVSGTRSEDRLSSLVPSQVQPPTQLSAVPPHTAYRHNTHNNTPTASSIRSDTIKVESETPLGRFSSAARRRDPYDSLALGSTAANTVPDYSTHTTMPRPNDPILPPPNQPTTPSSMSGRSFTSSPPKSILKKRSRSDSIASHSTTGYKPSQSTTSYPWSAPTGDQLLSVPLSNNNTYGTAGPATIIGVNGGAPTKKPVSPSKRVTFNM